MFVVVINRKQLRQRKQLIKQQQRIDCSETKHKNKQHQAKQATPTDKKTSNNKQQQQATGNNNEEKQGKTGDNKHLQQQETIRKNSHFQ